MKKLFLLLLFSLAFTLQNVSIGVSSGGKTITIGPLQNGAIVTIGTPCGPPAYNCASTSLLDPGFISSPFPSGLVSNNISTCTGMCQNSTAYDTTIPGNLANTECITDMTDGTTFSGKSIGNMTGDGGDNGVYSSINEDYIAIVSTGGSANLLHVNPNGNCIQVINTGSPAIHVSNNFAFSRNDLSITPCVASSGGYTNCDQRFYYLNHRTELHQVDFDVTASIILNDQILIDIFGTNSCPGITAFSTSQNSWNASILSVSADDTEISWAPGPNGQGSSDWVIVWDRNLGCFTANMNTGNWYTFCKSPSTCNNTTAASGTYTTGCWGSQGSLGNGIHDVQATQDKGIIKVSGTENWTQGYCGIQSVADGAAIIQINGNGNTWVHGGASKGLTGFGPEGYNWGNHESEGQSSSLSASFNGPNIRLMTSPGGGGTQFSYSGPYGTLGGPACQDVHGSWFHRPGNVDTYPWISACDSVLPSAGSAGTGNCTIGTSAVYCPKHLQNTIFASFPTVGYPPGQAIRVFTHTFSCNPTGGIYAHCTGGGDSQFGAQNSIGYVTQKGNFFCWSSSMLQSRGLDNNGKPRMDAFCVHLQ